MISAIPIDDISSWIGVYLWPFFRIGAMLQVAPITGTRMVPARVRLVLAMSITMLIAPLIEPGPAFDGIGLNAMLVTMQQVLIGVVMGLFMQLLFQIFVVGGQMIAMQTGMGMAQTVDPTSGVNVAVVGQFYLIFVTLLFITMNGPLMMIEVLIESFYTIPIAVDGLTTASIWKFITMPVWMFKSALILALPPVTAILCVNLTFGVMTKSAPQLNIFSLGFPATMLFGLLIMWISLTAFVPLFERNFYQSFILLREIVGA